MQQLHSKQPLLAQIGLGDSSSTDDKDELSDASSISSPSRSV